MSCHALNSSSLLKLEWNEMINVCICSLYAVLAYKTGEIVLGQIANDRGVVICPETVIIGGGSY